MPQGIITQSSGSAYRVQSQRVPHDALYAKRDYERRLVQSGRRVITVDIEADLVEKIDMIRGKARRGLILDELLQSAIQMHSQQELALP